MINDFQLTDGVLSFSPGITYIKCQHFAGNAHIEKVIIPPGVGFIEDEAFAECENLREVVLPEGLCSIGIAAFAGCTALDRIIFPSSLKNIGEGAFLDCCSLSALNFPDGLEEIADLAFQSTGLVSVTLPASLRLIGEEAFFDCSELRHADVLSPDCVIGINAFGCNYKLISGYIAPGYSVEEDPTPELLYSMLWCSCPERHSEAVCRRAEGFIRDNESLIVERILKTDNIPAATGLVNRQLLSAAAADSILKAALDHRQPELAALMLRLKGSTHNDEGEFEL